MENGKEGIGKRSVPFLLLIVYPFHRFPYRSFPFVS